MQDILSKLSNGSILVSDGAWGTFLQQKGLQPGECPEAWCLTHPDAVTDIASSYIVAGADMVETNSFGASRFKLASYGLEDKTAAINEAAARLSRTAAGTDHFVIASIGPTGQLLIMEEVTPEEIYAAFKEQAQALAKGGADGLCIETMSAIDEATLAIKAARENTNCTVICTFTFSRTVQGDYRTMMGVSPNEAAIAAKAAGAHIVGANCSNGFEQMIPITRAMRAAVPDLPILIHANAGLPKNVNGQDVFPESPEDMAARVPALVAAGANIIGGCCGTTPAHIRAIKTAVAAL